MSSENQTPNGVDPIPPAMPIPPITQAEPEAGTPIPPPQLAPPPLPPLKPTQPTLVDLLIGVAITWGVDGFMGVVFVLVVLGPTILKSIQNGVLTPAQFEQPMSPAAVLITSILSSLCALTVSWFLACRKYQLSFGEGLGFRRVSARLLAASTLLGLVGGIAASLLVLHFGKGESFMAELSTAPYGAAVIITIALLLPPVEEIYYRGFIFPILQRKIGAWAILIVAAWFTGAHVMQLAGDWIGVPVILVMGTIWTAQRHFSDSLVPGLVTHWTYNFVQILLAFYYGWNSV